MWRRKARDKQSADDRAKAEAALRRTERLTPLIERFAEQLTELPAEEFAARVRRAFGRTA